MRNFLLTCAVLCVLSLTGAELPSAVKLQKDGSFKIGDAEFFLQTYNSSWTPVTSKQFSVVKSEQKNGNFSLTATARIDDTEMTVSETVAAVDPENFKLQSTVKFPAPIQLNLQCGALRLPVSAKAGLTIDGKELKLPETFGEMSLFGPKAAKTVAVQLPGGQILKISGDFMLAVQDNRKFNNPEFSLRFYFKPATGKIESSELALDFQLSGVTNTAVDLSKAGTRSFAWDGKQGWSDQGSENDLSMFQLSEVKYGYLRFAVAKSAKPVLALGGASQGGYPQQSSIELSKNSNIHALNLLHTSAWTPPLGQVIGQVVVTFADGKTQIIPVTSRIDCGNWWGPMDAPNGLVVWTGENPRAEVGLYASSFALNGADPVKLDFKTVDPNVIWLIAGVTLTDEVVRLAPTDEKEVVIQAGREWAPVEYNRQIVPGSALDFSWVADAPAGKYGWIKVSADGKLIYEQMPQKPLKLYGANLCFSANYPDAATADRMVDYFVKMGYNTIRFHHMDGDLLDKSAADSLTFDPAKLDKLDYLFAKCKEKGLYVTVDFYVNRVFKVGDNIPECTFYSERQMKMLVPVSKAAMDNWKEFVRRWMTHVNPYTKLAWGGDPALFAVNLVNEENLTVMWNKHPDSAKLYTAKFAEWCQANGKQGKPNKTDPAFRAFLDDVQGKCLAEQMRFVKEDLKLKTLVTSLNFVNDVPLALLRNEFDVVDNHSYFDHPGFPEKQWSLPYSYKQDSAVKRMAAVPRNMMGTRIFGKPFMVTEFNYCFPNRYRAEGGPLIGAYGALQNWDALYRFGWSHAIEGIVNLGPANGFDAVNEPMAQLADRIAVAMFVRGDVKAAPVKVSYTVSKDIYKDLNPLDFPEKFQQLGLIAQIGSNVAGTTPAGTQAVDLAASTDPAKLKDAEVAKLWAQVNETRVAKSSTGEIVLDAGNQTLAVNTPCSLSVTLPKGELTAGLLTVKNVDVFQTVALISLDHRPIAVSKRVLLVQLTNLANSGQTFGNRKLTLLRNPGKLPLLVLRAKAQLELTVDQPFAIQSLKLDGTPVQKLDSKFANGVQSFTVDTGAGLMAYELTR